MDENIKYELAEAEKLEVIDNAGVAENEKKSIVTVLLSLSCCGPVSYTHLTLPTKLEV